MVHALVNISSGANRVINIVKARYDLNDKSQAIEAMVQEYEEFLLEKPLNKEFAEKLKKIRQGRFRKVKSLDELLD